MTDAMLYGSGSLSYLLWMIPLVILSAVASAAVNSRYRTYSKIRTSSGLTGDEVSRLILRANGIYNVPVQPISGTMTDCYMPDSNLINLSEGVYGVPSVAAAGIAAHETGHALQYAQGYAPVRLRMALLPVANFASKFSWILILVGLAFSAFQVLAEIGVILFGAVFLFQLLTLPVEFNASRRAVAALADSGQFTQEELGGVKKVLFAAAMTYLVAMLTTLWQMARYVLLVFGGDRGRRR